MKVVILVTCLLVSSFSFAKDQEKTGANAQAVNAACAPDAATAGCGDQKVGTGLMKCLKKYKKAHKGEFQFSDACKSAIKTMRSAHKGGQ